MSEFLFTPGPTNLPERVRRAMAEPIPHHRTKGFRALFAEAGEKLAPLLGTSVNVLTLAASGTGGMEAAVSNLLSPGDRAVAVVAGKFGERWVAICRAYGIDVLEVPYAWGVRVAAEPIAEALRAHRPAALFVTHSETSTGVLLPLEEIAALTRGTGVLLVVDAITSVGVHPVEMDARGVDVVVTGSQKGLMIPPGLAFLALSRRAWERVEKARLPRFYFDLFAARKGVREGDAPFTPAITLVLALHEALRMIEEEGLERVWSRHAAIAAYARAAATRRGFRLFAETPSNGVTALLPPDGVDAAALTTALVRDHGMRIAGGQGKMAGKMVRIGHMGHVFEDDLARLFEAMDRVLAPSGSAGGGRGPQDGGPGPAAGGRNGGDGNGGPGGTGR